MNLSAISSILGVATQVLGGSSPLGAFGSLACAALGGGQAQSGSASDPLSAILSLTSQADGLASGGLATGALGSIAGLLA